MPASTSTRFTLAHAKASARLPKSVISAQTKTPTIHALRKQPRTNTATGSHPGASTRKSKAHQPSTASKRKRAPPRAIPTSHEPRVRCRIPMGARNWCFTDFDQTSSRTAYATSSWQTLTTDSAMVPISTKDACSGVRWRNRVMRPMESTPTIGQKRSSKKKNTLREAMSALRTTTAQTASSSARQLNEHLLQLGLPHLHVPHHDALRVQGAQEVGQPLLGHVHRALDPAVHRGAAEHAGRLREPWHGVGVELQRDHIAEADPPLELARRAAREDPALPDEGDPVADHVVAQHAHGPRIRRQQGREDRQERRLPRAVRAEQPDDGAARDGEGHAAQRRGAGRAEPPGLEGLRHVVGVDREHRPRW